MNYLAHFHLSAPQPGLIVGSVLGDYIKGRLAGAHPPAMERGIQLHRAIDGFTDRHPLVKQSHRRFHERFRRYAPLMTDIIFDHFLAKYWDEFHERTIEDFHDDIFAVLDAHRHHLPEQARQWCERVGCSRALVYYDDTVFVRRSLTYLSRRLSRQNPLAEGFGEFERMQGVLEADFRAFYPDLVKFVSHWKAEHVH